MYPIFPEGEFVLLFSFDDECENLNTFWRYIPSKYIYLQNKLSHDLNNWDMYFLFLN